MFGLDLSEFALIGIVALLFIGPKDMPVAIRTVTGMLKKGRKLAQEFQGHVDDMIRDADLGEARDQFRQLRSLNVRGQVMRALDADGSMQRALQDDPLKPKLALPPQATTTATTTATTMPGRWPADPEPVRIEERTQHGAAMTQADPALDAAERAALEAADPAPSILPPAVASRLRAERARPAAPRFVPPRSAGPLPDAARRPS